VTSSITAADDRPSPALPARIFVTGASGFIGRALVERCRALGAIVRGMDRVADPARDVVAGDVSRDGDWQLHARGCELFLHTAAVVSNTAPAAAYRAVTIGGTRRALDAAVAGGCRRFVHLSSIAAYGMDFPDGVAESHPVTALSGLPYCDAKAASEHVVLAAHAAGEMDCTIVRPGDVYGPGSRPWILLPLAMMRQRLFVLPDRGTGIFSPVYVDDLVDGILLAATSALAAGRVFNLTDGRGVACREFFAHHWQWLGRRGEIPTLPAALAGRLAELVRWSFGVAGRPTEMSAASVQMLARRGTYSIAAAGTRLGYVPRVAVAEGMRRAQLWLEQSGYL
jgi:nucleoside-diphosphate-sugar epimerase